MRSAIFLVTAFVAASTATPWGSRGSQQCASYCRENSKFKYSVGTVYSYDYTGETASKIGGTLEQESRLHINAQAEFQVVSQCELVLRLKTVTLEQSDPQDGSSKSITPGSSQFAAGLEQQSLLFSFQDGQIEHICPSVDDPVWSLNIKRGILSAMQNSMRHLASSQLVFETDVVGHCETNYTVENVGRNGVTLSRSKDLLACTGRSGHHSAPILSTPYSSSSSIQSLPLLRSENECQQTIRNQLLEKSVCTETHLFRPFSNGQSGASTRITQTLTYRSERRSDQVLNDYKKKKTSLLFEGADGQKNFGSSLSVIADTLNTLVQESTTGISPQTPAIFSQLVTALRSLSYSQLSQLFGKTRNSPANKYLMNAAPLVGTAASYGLMRDIIEEGLLGDLEVDMWLASLAFQPKPTLEMITAVSPLLAETVRPKALLSISAMIHAYCRGHSSGCQTEEAVKEAVAHIEKRIGTACRSRDAQQHNNILLALKALGNAGLVVSSSETLTKCYQEETNDMVIRLAAIDAIRRVPCHLNDRTSLLFFYLDAKKSSELRIGAYLAAMQCPSPQLLEKVKQALIGENINQVGSFVWTHLTNLQETTSPSKQAVRQLLANEFLRNKFNTDARKFSRNLEASSYWQHLNVGGTVESNIVFSSQSYLPRSATLNLTLDLFGESVNLLELGARLEGFESLVESFFGPSGFFPDDSIQKVLETLRSKRAAPVDEQSLNQLSTVFDVKGQMADQPQGDLYLRIFGNELHNLRFQGLDQLTGNPFQSPLAILLQAVGQKDVDFSKSMSIMDVSYVLPTAVGLPLTLTVNATATVAFKMGGTLQTASLSDVKVMGHVKPSGTIDINGLMVIDAGTFMRSGVHVQNVMHTSTSLSGKMMIQGNRLVSVHMDAPQEATNTFSYDSRLFLLQQNGHKEIEPDNINRRRINMKSCSPTWLSQTFGVQLCGQLDFYPATPNGPGGPFSGPKHAALFLRKTDTHSSYRLEYKREGNRAVSLMMDTPDSAVNRRLSAQVTIDEVAKSLRANFVCPTKSVDATGKYEYNQLTKGMDVMLSVDGAELVSFRTSLRTDLKGASGRYEPNLVVSKRGRELVNFQGYFSFVADTKYGFDFQLKHLTGRPIRISGDFSKDNDNKHEYSVGVKSYLLDATLVTTMRISDKLATSKTRIGYSLMEGTSHNLELSGKFNRAVKGSLKKTVLAGIVQSSQFPQYNGDFSWDVQQSENYLENNMRLNAGSNLWEAQQLYSVQQRDVNVRLSVTCKEEKIDFLIFTLFENSDTTLTSQSGLRLSPERQWMGKLDLIRQDYQPGRRYGGRIQVSSPTTRRQLRADISQEKDKQWDLIVEYSANEKVEASVEAVYKDLSAGINWQHSVEMKLRSWAADELDLNGQFLATTTHNQLDLNGRYGDRKLSGTVEYHRDEMEHAVSARIVRDERVPILQVNLNAGSKKSISIDIQADRHVTFDVAISPKLASVQFFWNKDVDLSQSLAFAGKLSATGGDAQLTYKSWPAIRMNVDRIDKDLKIQMEWNDNQVAILRMELLPTRTTGLLSTPFDGFRRITFDTLHQVSHNSLDVQLTVDWQQDRFTLSVDGRKTSDNIHGSVKLISTLSQLEKVGAEFKALASQPMHRYSVAVHHQDRRAQLSADYHRKEFRFKSASINLATPFNGYESLKLSIDHNQVVASFQTDVNLDGPFASRAAVTLAGRNVKSELAANLTVTTNFSALQHFTTWFQLSSKQFDKKLTVVGDVNGQKMTGRAFTNFVDGKFRADLHVSSPLTDDVRASLNHRYENNILKSQGFISWANEKNVQVDVDGQFGSGRAAVNATLSTPNWAASGRLDHKKVADKMDTFAEAVVSGQRVTFTFNSHNLELDNVRLESKLTTPFRGFENLSLSLQHRRQGKKTTTLMKAARSQKEITVEHDVEYIDLFNWANRLAVVTPFQGLSSLTVDSNQLWTNILQHDGQLDINGKRMTVALKADKSQPGKMTASGSLSTSWSEDVTFELTHSDDGIKFHPTLIIRTGNDQPIRLETVYRRGPKNPGLVVEVVSPLSEPLKLSAAYNNSLPVQSAKLSLNWNRDKNIDWTLDWALAALQSSIKSRLSTPFSRNNRIEADVMYDVTGKRKTATIQLRRDQQTVNLDAFAAGQGSGYQSQLVLSSSFYKTVKVSAVVDMTEASIKLERGNSQIHFHGVLVLASGQTTVTATLETPFNALRQLKVDASLKSNRELQLEIDFDGQKISLTGSHSSGPAKASLRASIKTPFAGIESANMDTSYDAASGVAKTASLTLSRNEKVIQASGQLVLIGPIKLALNVRAPCCGIKQLDVTGSYDESAENKSGHLKLDLNGEKYQLDGKLIRRNGTAEIGIESLTGHRGYEQVVINAKYDVIQPTKTGSIVFKRNDQRFLFSAAVGIRSVVLDLATPIAPFKTVRLEGRFDAETAVLTLIRNEEVVKLTAAGSFASTLIGKLDCSLETPYSGYENLHAQLVYDLQSPRKLIVLDAGSFRCEIEWNGVRLVVRSTTPIVGYEQLELTGDYVLDNRQLLAAVLLKKNNETIEIRFNGLLDLKSREASFEFQSPVPFVRILSSKIIWNFHQDESKSFNFQASRNDMTMEVEMNGRFVPDNSALTVEGRSNVDGWNSASLSFAYDIRTSISASLNLEKNGVHQSFTGNAKFDKESAALNVETPFEGMRTMGLSGTLVDASKTNVSSDRTATLRLQKEGQSQDYVFALSFDANSATMSIGTPFRHYEKMSAEVGYVGDQPQKTLSLVVKKNNDKVEFNGQARNGEAELKLSTTLKGLENVVVTCRYDLLSAAKTLALKLNLNEKTIQLNGSVQGLKMTIDLTTPFAGFEYVNFSGDVQLTPTKIVGLMLQLNGQSYEVSGSLTDRKLIAQIKTPIDGFQVTDISARWTERRTEFRLESSSWGTMILSTEYDLDDKSLQFGRVVVNHNGINYRNELVAKLADPWIGGEMLVGVQLPLDGLRNVTSTLAYDLGSSDKSVAMTLDTSVVHYETTASLNFNNESGKAVIHFETPVASWEEIDLSAGYDLTDKKSVFVLSERNGKSVVFIQGLATLSAMSSIVSSSIRVPSLLNDDVEIVAAYNVAVDSVDAKIKYCAHEILLDGHRSDDWTGAKAAISTTFQHLQSAQINWNLAKKTASLHVNGLKATLDGRIESAKEAGFVASLSDPILLGGTHSAEIEWNILSDKFTGLAEYRNGQNVPFGANASINFSVEKGDYQVTVHTGRPTIGDVQLIGRWVSGDKIKSQSALHWAGSKKFEAVFDGQFSALGSIAGLSLSTPNSRPIKTEIQYDFASAQKSFKFNHNSAFQFITLLTAESMIQWNGKIDAILKSEKYSAMAKCNVEPVVKEFMIQLENFDVAVTELRMTMLERNQRIVINANVNGPAFENKLTFNGDYDPSTGMNCSGNFSWAANKKIQANFLLTWSQLTAELVTPFKGLEKTNFSVKYVLGQPKNTVDSVLVWAGGKMTASADWQLMDGLVFSVRLTTPFQGFEQVGIGGTFLAGSDYATTLYYTRDGKVVEIQGKLTSNPSGSTARITFVGENELLAAVVEYDVRNPKKTASMTLSRGSNQRLAVTAAGEFSDKINSILTIETSSSSPIRISFEMDPISIEKNGRLAVEWGQQEKLELTGSGSMTKTGSKFRLAAQTPFEGFKKILVNTRMNQKIVELSVEYGRNRKLQLNGQYRFDPKLSVYSLNGTLSTPWLEHTLSGQSYVELSNGFHGTISVSPEPEKKYNVTVTYRKSGSFETSIQTPMDVLRSAQLSGAFETDSFKSSKRFAAGMEYNGRQASMEGRLNGHNAFVKGSWNNEAISIDTFYQPGFKMAANVTTPFEGYQNWAGRLERIRTDDECDVTLHLMTPLASLPSIDANVHALLEVGQRLEMSTWATVLGHTGRAKLDVSKSLTTYLASIQLEMPFVEILKSANIRAECQIDGWKNLVTTVTAGVPAGEYTVKGSMLIGKSSLNLNAAMKTPSFAKSIEMGAGYNAANLDLVQGEIFVWDNKIEGRYEKRANQMSVELSFNLPDLELAHKRLNFDVNFRSARQLQSSVSFITLDKSHTLSVSYQLAGSKFTGQLDIDSPVFVQSKKTLSLKLNYGSLTAMTFDGRYVDGQSTCELTGSMRLSAGTVHGQTKLSCPMFGTVAVEIIANPTEGKLMVTAGPSLHKLDYKLNANRDGYDVTINAESPLIKPLHLRAIWMLADGQQGQASMTVRHGESAHSILVDYLRSAGDKTAGSLSMASPFLPGGQASIQLQYQPFDLSVQVDMMGQSHRLTGLVQRWPSLNGRLQVESSLLPWKTVALNAQVDGNVRDRRANMTANYGDQSVGLAGRLRYSKWSDFEATMELNTPFQGLTMARADVQLSAINAQRVNASINFQSSHVLLPRASFNVQYHLSKTALDASATLNTPFSRWETVGLTLSIPLAIHMVNDVTTLAALSLPGSHYSVSGLVSVSGRQLLTEWQVDYAGRKFSAQILFKGDDIYQAKIDVKTPFRGFENYLWDVKGQADVRRWGEATAFLDWNGKRIEFSSNVKAEPLAYIAVVQLNTPFVDFERYAVHLRLEGTQRKTLQIEVESPGVRVGADFDYSFNSATDFVGKASIRTPLVGYESFTLHLSNQLGKSSYSANAEARFADYGVAASVEGLIGDGRFQAQMDGRYNDRVVVLKSGGSLDEKRVTCNVDLITPFEQLKTLAIFVQLEKDLAESKGFGLSVNGRQLILVTLSKQTDGLHMLQINNPWRPVDLSYSWENSAHLIHYQVQLCWDLNRRTSATLGGRVIMKTSSYGRQISVKTVTPRRELSFNYSLELTSAKVDHSVSVSWAANKTVGYRVVAENGSNRRRTQLSGSVRFDLPARSFQLQSQHSGGENTSTHVEFQWDAVRDAGRRLAVRLETHQGRQIRLIFIHPELDRDIVLQAEFDRINNNNQLIGKMELIYSPLEEHGLIVQGSISGQETVQFVILHPASNTDLRLVTSLKKTELQTRLDYKDRFNVSRFLQLGGKMVPEERRIDFEVRTTENSLSLTNTLTLSPTSYALASRTLVNDVEALNVDARLETSSLRPRILQIDGSYGGGKSFNLLAGMPDMRDITVRAVRDMHGRKITDGHFQIKLNKTDLLSSRLYWRAASGTELRDAVVNGLIDVLAACESFADDFANFVGSELTAKCSNLTPAARLISQRLTDSLNVELDNFRSEFSQMAVELVAMYERNDFYLHNIVATIKQMTSLAQPFIDRTLANMEAISQTIIGESEVFYRAAVSSYNSLAQLLFSGYQQWSSYVCSGVNQVARYYSHLAGEVMRCLIHCESVVSRTFQRIESIIQNYAGRLESVVMQQVEEIRIQLIEMVNYYEDMLRPYTQYLDVWVERARLFYFQSLDDINYWCQMVRNRFMTYPLFQRLHSVYLEYSSWLEELHAQDYIDDCINYVNQLKEEWRQRIKIMTTYYQPLVDPLVQAYKGQMDAFKQLPLVVYVNTVVHRVNQQFNELSKLVQLEVELRRVLRDLLKHADRLTAQLINDLKGSLSFPLKPTVVIDWQSGRLEYTQRLPFTWEDFSQLPRIRELPLLRKMATAKKNFIREMDHSQFYFTTMNLFATYRPMRIRSILPPFGSRAFVAGTQHYMTFDRRFYEFAGECSYLLASDFLRNDFSAIVNYEGAGGKVTRKSLTILSDNRQVEIDSSFRVTLNGRKIEMPLTYDSTSIVRDGQRLIVTNNKSGFQVDCNLYRDICTVHVTGWSFGKTGGLFGVYNNEPADDLLTPFHQQRSDDQVDSFANSWKVGTSRCRVRNFAVTRPNPNGRNNRLCDQLFVDDQSILRPCFQMVDPTPFSRMCLNDLTSLENSPKKETGVCTAAAAYVSECRFAGLDLFVPAQCVRCELEDGRVIGSGEIKTFQNDAPRSADVVFIVDQKPCLNGTRLSYLPAAIDAALRERGIQHNRFAVVGYGGRGGQLFEKPHIRTVDNGQIWSNRKGIQSALEDLPLADQQQSPPSDGIHSALRYAINLPYRVGVSKQFVLISCAGSECQASSYADTLTLLIENDVKLHLLQPRDIVVKGKNSSDELKNVFGFDAEEIYTVRNIRSLKGDRELRRQLSMPKDFCTPLSLETNGTLFDLKKMMAGQQQQQTKKFIDIFARRVAVTGEPSPCQRCDCIGDRDGIGSILCQRCVSPIMDRLDKVWEQLSYENEMARAADVEDVTVSQIRDPQMDRLTTLQILSPMQ